MPGSASPPDRTIVLGSTLIEPANLTMSHDETLSFVSTADQPLTTEFTQPRDQADRIKCRVADPKASPSLRRAGVRTTRPWMSCVTRGGASRCRPDRTP